MEHRNHLSEYRAGRTSDRVRQLQIFIFAKGFAAEQLRVTSESFASMLGQGLANHVAPLILPITPVLGENAAERPTLISPRNGDEDPRAALRSFEQEEVPHAPVLVEDGNLNHSRFRMIPHDELLRLEKRSEAMSRVERAITRPTGYQWSDLGRFLLGL
jgi:hypothetical protein